MRVDGVDMNDRSVIVEYCELLGACQLRVLFLTLVVLRNHVHTVHNGTK